MGKKASVDDSIETETDTSGGEPLGIMGGGKAKKPSKSKTAKAGLVMPIPKINRHLRDAKRSKRVGGSAPVYLSAVLEYAAAEIFEMAMNGIGKRKRLTATDILRGVRSDNELKKLFSGESVFVGDRVTGVSSAVTIKPPVPESA